MPNAKSRSFCPTRNREKERCVAQRGFENFEPACDGRKSRVLGAFLVCPRSIYAYILCQVIQGNPAYNDNQKSEKKKNKKK